MISHFRAASDGTKLGATYFVHPKGVLTALLSLPGMKLPPRTIYFRALALYAQAGIDFPDCLTVAHLEYEQLHQLYSYDQDFDRFTRIKRLEPEQTRPIVAWSALHCAADRPGQQHCRQNSTMPS